jgi:hypothetical protein
MESTVDKDTTSGLLSGTTSVLTVPWDKRWLVIKVQDVTHAVDPGTPGIALCGVRPPKGPDGTLWPRRQFISAALCLRCAEHSR